MKFIWASELVSDSHYWELVVRTAKATSINRVMRTMPIMGRGMKEANLESAWIFYPAMQVADMFHMNIDIAVGGMDQRKAHMLARDVAPKLNLKKPIALHTELLTGLSGEGVKMDFDENPDLANQIASKMSKSLPDTCIFIHDEPLEIKRKLKKAYCPAGITKGNPVIDIARLIIFPRIGELEITRPTKYGGDIAYSSYETLLEDFSSGNLHPSDLKNGTAEGLIKLLKPVRDYFKKHPEALDTITNLSVTR